MNPSITNILIFVISSQKPRVGDCRWPWQLACPRFISVVCALYWWVMSNWGTVRPLKVGETSFFTFTHLLESDDSYVKPSQSLWRKILCPSRHPGYQFLQSIDPCTDWMTNWDGRPPPNLIKRESKSRLGWLITHFPVLGPAVRAMLCHGCTSPRGRPACDHIPAVTHRYSQVLNSQPNSKPSPFISIHPRAVHGPGTF